MPRGRHWLPTLRPRLPGDSLATVCFEQPGQPLGLDCPVSEVRRAAASCADLLGESLAQA